MGQSRDTEHENKNRSQFSDTNVSFIQIASVFQYFKYYLVRSAIDVVLSKTDVNVSIDVQFMNEIWYLTTNISELKLKDIFVFLFWDG